MHGQKPHSPSRIPRSPKTTKNPRIPLSNTTAVKSKFSSKSNLFIISVEWISLILMAIPQFPFQKSKTHSQNWNSKNLAKKIDALKPIVAPLSANKGYSANRKRKKWEVSQGCFDHQPRTWKANPRDVEGCHAHKRKIRGERWWRRTLSHLLKSAVVSCSALLVWRLVLCSQFEVGLGRHCSVPGLICLEQQTSSKWGYLVKCLSNLSLKGRVKGWNQTSPGPLTTNILSDSPSNGSRLRVAHLGVRGAYSESAAEMAYPNCEPVPCEQFDTAFEAVERWIAERAVLPIENSLGGSIHRNYDLLLRHRLYIVGEVRLAIRHCLLANHGVKIEDLKRVLSHPQALAQCEHTLSRIGLVREAVYDTAGAAKSVAFHKFKDVGAVASASAARNYGLNILAENIQDDSDNVTRFLMLAREPIIPGTDRPHKTSIVFSLEEGPGALFKALAVFALRNINLTKIESRPRQMRNIGASKCFDYLFYLDFDASVADENSQYALGHLKEFATMLRVLGSYPTSLGII